MSKFLLGLMAAILVTLTTASLAVAQSSYKIHPGDTLQLEVLEDSSLNRPLLVLPDGTVSVPMIGSLQASGRSVDEVRAAVADGLAANFATKPTVYMSVGQLAAPTATTSTAATMSIYIIGEVLKPGKVDVPRNTTLLQFLAESGGFTDFAALKRIQLRRLDPATGVQKNVKFNYQALMAGEDIPAIKLQPGDVIIVPQRHLFE